ncbi:assimilatory nitrate reductase catalytic subunit NasC [Halalkalibacterium halodurans]|uniref:assimilatory nitrate reductase catalytic subunit NasC n=1 Tax=Halalkalibacterium halodurans TaxID=86665 RepID=UPI001FBC0E69|nr:nitrate reductase [Halalkalibacterium halodurans]
MIQFFREKQKQQGKEARYDTRCPFCSVQCSMTLTEEKLVATSRFKAIPNKQDPTSEGRLCIKGVHAHQHTVHRERIRQPLVKTGGAFVETSWEVALGLIAERFKRLQKSYGQDAVGVFGGGSLTNEEAYLLGKFARLALGTRYIDYNGRYCMSSAAAAANLTFGVDRGLTNELREVEDAECIVLAGTNLAECQPTLMPYLRRAKKNGAFIIVLDPRETGTTKIANLHLKPKPGTDGAIAAGMFKVLIEEELIDRTFIEARTNGFEQVKSELQEIALAELALAAGVPEEQIREAAIRFGEAQTGMIFTARGVEQQATGTADVRQFLHILLATGKIGRYACGYGAVTGQGNGQGGREHGQKADQLPGYRSIESPEDRAYIASVWNVEEKDIPRKGVSAFELFQKIDQQDVRGMFIMGSNPVLSSPHENLVKRALSRLDVLVVVDMFISETAEYADIILPTTSYLEDEGTMTNFEGRVVHRPGSKPPFGKAKHDWQILCELAEALDRSHGFQFSSPEEIFNELCLASKGGKADYSGLSYEKIKGEGVLWPCPTKEHEGTGRLFEDRFYTENGRAQFGSVHCPVDSENGEYPLLLTTGRVLTQYLSGTQTRRSDALLSKEPEPFVLLHPETASSYQIQDEDWVMVRSPYGEAKLKARQSEGIREDTVFVPFHWAGSVSINHVVAPELDPTSRMPAFKRTKVQLMKIIEEKGESWYSGQKNDRQESENTDDILDPVHSGGVAKNR